MMNKRNNNKNVINHYNQIDESPIISSYFIPNTPMINQNNHNKNIVKQVMIKERKEEEEEEVEVQEPGSTKPIKRTRQRRRASQPEGLYSPIPKSKIMSELNQSGINIRDINQCFDEKEKEKDEDGVDEYFVSSSSELSQRKSSNDIRNEVLREIERMDEAIDKELNDKHLLLHPLSAKMSKLKITQKINLSNYKRYMDENNDIDMIDKTEKNKFEAMHFAQNISIYEEDKSYESYKASICGSVVKYICNKDIWSGFGLNIMNIICVLFVLVLYCKIIDLQWK